MNREKNTENNAYAGKYCSSSQIFSFDSHTRVNSSSWSLLAISPIVYFSFMHFSLCLNKRVVHNLHLFIHFPKSIIFSSLLEFSAYPAILLRVLNQDASILFVKSRHSIWVYTCVISIEKSGEHVIPTFIIQDLLSVCTARQIEIIMAKILTGLTCFQWTPRFACRSHETRNPCNPSRSTLTIAALNTKSNGICKSHLKRCDQMRRRFIFRITHDTFYKYSTLRQWNE